MSLSSSLNIAFSSIRALGQSQSTIADNIANSKNENYNQRRTVVEDVNEGGVRVANIVRRVNDALQQDFLQQGARAAGAEERQNLYDQIEFLSGAGQGESLLSKAFLSFDKAWKEFEGASDADAARRQIVLAGEQIVNELGRLSEGLDQIETQINTDVENNVQQVNEILREISRLNDEIVREQIRGRPIAGLQNLRDAQLSKLSGMMEFRVFNRPDSAIHIYSANNVILLTDRPTRFTVRGGDLSPALKSANGRLPEGRLKALLDFVADDRESIESNVTGLGVIGKLRRQLNELAYTLVDDARFSASGTLQLEPVQTIVSIAGIEVGDSFAINTIDANDPAAARTVTLTAGETTQSLLEKINAIDGVRARLDIAGRLEISSTATSEVLELTDISGAVLQNLGLITTPQENLVRREPPTLANAYANAPIKEGESANLFVVRTDTGFGTGSANRTNIQVNESLRTGDTRIKLLSATPVLAAWVADAREIKGASVEIMEASYIGLANGIGNINTKHAAFASRQATNETNLRNTLETALRNDVGVDIDEETTIMLLVEKSHAATGKVITYTNRMFDELFAAVR